MMLKLKVDHVYQATQTVIAIINENRAMPQKASYRLARLYAKLKPEFDLIAARRDAMIEAYNHKALDPIQVEGEPPRYAENYSVPPDKIGEWKKAWTDMGDEEIDIEVDPLPLEQFDRGDAAPSVLTAGELIALGDLVKGD